MNTLDWQAKATDRSGIGLLDRAPESAGIDLAAVRDYRLAGVRREMSQRGIEALILSDTVIEHELLH